EEPMARYALFAAACSLGCTFKLGSGGNDGFLIGPQGGAVSAGNGIVLQIPQGALSADTRIKVSSASGPAGAFSQVETFEPQALAFAVPATITFPYTGSDPVAV